MSENKDKRELSTDEAKQIAGGDTHPRKGCQHLRKVRTGNEREESYFIFWSKHQYEYCCVHCGATFWVTEERD